MSYLLIVLLIGLLILVHELGHFLAARWMRMPVRRFSIGFGPRLWGFQQGQTDYWLSAVPLGGYVMLHVEDEQEYFRLPVHQRLVFALGGPLANLVLPVVLFALLNLLGGDRSLYGILVAPVVQTWQALGQLLAMIPQLFSRSDAISGVLGIVVQGGQFVGGDLQKALHFMILLSLNLAVLNLLPIPVLDGGKIVLHLLEKVHPKATALYVPLSALGLLLILGLFVYTTVLDVTRYVV